MPKLQLALDDITLEDALCLLSEIHEYIDIVEAGTPFVLQYGMHAIRMIKSAFPLLSVLCDGKIMDAGSYEAEEMFTAGADYITVLALTDDSTITDCVQAASAHHGKVMADMICVPDPASRAKELEALSVDIIAVHTGVDRQAMGHTPLKDLAILKQAVSSASIAVAGGITLQTLDEYLALSPDIIIIGGGIIKQKDRSHAARKIWQKIHGQQSDI